MFCWMENYCHLPGNFWFLSRDVQIKKLFSKHLISEKLKQVRVDRLLVSAKLVLCMSVDSSVSQHHCRLYATLLFKFRFQLHLTMGAICCHNWGQYYGGWWLSSDDSFHSPSVIPPSALDKPSIMKHYHCRRTRSHTSSPHRSPMLVTLHDTRFIECRWWSDSWTVKTVVTWWLSTSMIPAPGLHELSAWVDPALRSKRLRDLSHGHTHRQTHAHMPACTHTHTHKHCPSSCCFVFVCCCSL